MTKKLLKYVNNENSKTNEEVIFVATQYKNKPINMYFYTKNGEYVPARAVTKRETEEKGIHFFKTATN